ncbi:MAG: amidohydrolase family protein [candidate division KSB1 bacterium]|nr:amidohydrolase family protein [candidate division KSB1 bacterium]
MFNSYIRGAVHKLIIAGFGLMSVLSLSACEKRKPYDIVIRNGRVLDGTGLPAQRIDIAIAGDKIVAMGRIAGNLAPKTIDAAGRIVAPGFIDLRNHSAKNLARSHNARMLLSQGITTVMLNADGGPRQDIWPLAAFLFQFEKDRPAVNVAAMVSHNTLRHLAMRDGDYERPATNAEIELMEELLHKAFRDGAYGLSTDLGYSSSAYADGFELERLIRHVRDHSGLVSAAPRDPVRKFWASLEELYQLSRKTLQPILVGQLQRAPRWVWKLRQRWQKYLADDSPLLLTLFPQTRWYGEILNLVPQNEFFNWREVSLSLYRLGGAHRIRIESMPTRPDAVGKTLLSFAKQIELSPQRAFMEIVKAHGAVVSMQAIRRDQLAWILLQRNVIPVTDGGLDVTIPNSSAGFGYLLEMVEKQSLSLPRMVHKLTGFAAGLLQLKNRGLLRPGYHADILIFDPTAVTVDHSENTLLPPVRGMEWILVNGEIVLEQGRWTPARPGQVLRYSHTSVREQRDIVPN